jgi:hypothetical protein
MIISIADVGGGDEELERIVLVHVQLSRLNQFKNFKFKILNFKFNLSRVTMWIRIQSDQWMKNPGRRNWPLKKILKNITLLFSYGWSFSRRFEGQKEMYGTGIAFFSSIHI